MFLSSMMQELEALGGVESLPETALRPLHGALKKLSCEEIAACLPRLSKEQRQGLLDIELWEKDEVDVAAFEFWPQAYAACADDAIRLEFARGESFALYLKGRFNISTFDLEDPHYPDHDNWFLTEDNLLLFEFSEDNSVIEPTRQLIKDLYTEWGVERAYAFLFKLLADSFSDLQEEEYRFKKERLREHGFVDYYDALEVDNRYPNVAAMEAALKKRMGASRNTSDTPSPGALDLSLLAPYKGHLAGFEAALAGVSDQKRVKYLEFNFVRLVNAAATLQGGSRGGTLACHRAGRKARALLSLGMEWLQKSSLLGEKNLFEFFDFTDLYKIGNTLIGEGQRLLAGFLRKHFSSDEKFLGDHWSDFLSESRAVPCRFQERDISSLEDFRLWRGEMDCLVALLPFAARIGEVLGKLAEEGRVRDDFYLNYRVENIDLEAALLSSFANRRLGVPPGELKLGLSLDEFRRFVAGLINSAGVLQDGPQLAKDLADFTVNYGLDGVPGISDYLRGLLRAHLEGYDYAGLGEKDFRHVGGPVIFAGVSGAN